MLMASLNLTTGTRLSDKTESHYNKPVQIYTQLLTLESITFGVCIKDEIRLRQEKLYTT